MSIVAPIRAGDTLADHAEYISRYCRAVMQTAEFTASLQNARGHLTMTHVDLHSAKMSIARAKQAVDDMTAAADVYVRQPA